MVFAKISCLVGSRGFEHRTSGEITRLFSRKIPPFFYCWFILQDSNVIAMQYIDPAEARKNRKDGQYKQLTRLAPRFDSFWVTKFSN